MISKEEMDKLYKLYIIDQAFIAMEIVRPKYFVKVNFINIRDLIFWGEEYELDGIDPEHDRAIYKHHRRIKITYEAMRKYYYIINDPRR